jgi:WD40 repeat protein/DNA-binding SARP family transcriptional activator/energy-coupling factor transporter ATP-binding protein EcfA2
VEGRLAFRLLGPLEVRRGEQPVKLGGERQRALLAYLLLHANELVSSDALVEHVFGADPPANATNSLHAGISRLRRTLTPNGDDSLIGTQARGYVLRADADQLDTAVFEQRLATGRTALADGDAAAAAEIIGEALALWRGPPLADVAFVYPQPELARLEELRLAAVTDRIEAELALGRSSELVGELQALVETYPLHERPRGQLMLALYRAGRQADALEVYRSTRDLLRDELGLAPSRALQELERAILQQAETLDAKPPRRAVCPFKGLAAFEAADAPFFFGRERVVDELVARLATATFVGVVGPSGCGKSSIIRAGLLPALAEGALPASDARRHVVLRPSTAAALAADEPAVLAVDQLEEVFTAIDDEDERRSFLDELAAAAADSSRRALVVVGLRADFYGRFAAYPQFAKLLSANHVLVGPMSRDELRAAVERPAARAGLVLEHMLVDALVADVDGEPGALPLLSTMLLELWQLRDRDRLRLAAYRSSGGVRGAVARLAERAYATLEEHERDAARGIFLRLAGGEPEAPVRTRVRLDELSDAPGVLASLTEARLVTVDDGAVEVAHEALLREWPRLRDWLEEDRDRVWLRRRLAEHAREWAERERDAALLYRGAPLAAALAWAAEHEAELSTLEREFLEQSRLASERDAERQRSAYRRLRILVVAVAMLLAAAVVAGVLALAQRNSARDSALVADAQRLGAQALVQDRLDRALLLARQAWNMDPSPVTRGTLLASLMRAPAALRLLRGTGDRVQWIDITPDGRTLAVGDNGSAVAFFDTRANRRTRVVHVRGVTFGDAFSPDGRTLAAGGDEPLAGGGSRSFIAFVEVASGRIRYASFPSGWSTNDRVAYAPDGRAVATAEQNWSTKRQRLVERDPATFAALRSTAQPLFDFVATVRYSPDGRLLFVSGGRRGQDLTLEYDARTLRLLRTFRAGGFLAVAPDGRSAAVGTLEGQVTFLDVAGRRPAVTEQQDSSVQGIGFSPDGRTLVTVGDGRDVVVWDARSHTVRESLAGHSGRVFGPAFSPDGRTLYTSGLDGSIIAWDVGGARRLARPYAVVHGPVPGDAPDAAFLARAIAPDDRSFAIGTLAGKVDVFDTKTLRVTRSLQVLPPGREVTGLAYSPDGRRIAVGGSTGTPLVVDPISGRTIMRLPTPRFGAVSGLAFHGQLVAVAAEDGTVALADARTGRLVRQLLVSRSTPQDVHGAADVDFSPGGRRIAASGGDGFASVWDVASGRRIWRSRADRWFATSVRYSPGGRLVAVGTGQKGDVVFFDAATGRRAGAPLRASAGYVTAVSFAPDSRTVATSGTDSTTRLWDVTARKQIGTEFRGRRWAASTFFADGRRLLVADASGTGVVWDVAPDDLARRACAIAGRNLTRDEWQTFLPKRPYAPTC